jgi:hypothetical protein
MSFGNVEQNFDEEGIRAEERDKVLNEIISDINRTSLTGFTKYTYRRWILGELQKKGGGSQNKCRFK